MLSWVLVFNVNNCCDCSRCRELRRRGSGDPVQRCASEACEHLISLLLWVQAREWEWSPEAGFWISESEIPKNGSCGSRDALLLFSCLFCRIKVPFILGDETKSWEILGCNELFAVLSLHLAQLPSSKRLGSQRGIFGGFLRSPRTAQKKTVGILSGLSTYRSCSQPAGVPMESSPAIQPLGDTRWQPGLALPSASPPSLYWFPCITEGCILIKLQGKDYIHNTLRV